MSLDLVLCLDTAIRAAKTAGQLLQERQAGCTVREKGPLDLVTDVDIVAQQCIRKVIQEDFPDHGFLGEESSVTEHQQGKQEVRPQWIVDPIDGTVNYIHGLPFYAISIALAVGREIQVGVIYDPSHDELYQAMRGNPAHCNGCPLSTSNTASLSAALLAFGFSTKSEEQQQLLDTWRHFSLRTHGLRRTGSAALNLAYLTSGRVDAFYARGVHSWDVAAGILLVECAGGKVTDGQGKPFDMHQQREILASNGQLHEALIQELGLAAIPW
jgi:myo-inositol-1(or 4)-monophosphatase